MPLPFCNCRVCRAARTLGGKNLRKRSASLINGELLIDLSPDLAAMAALYRIDTARIRYLLQTHSHSDHFDAGHFVTRCSSYASEGAAHLEVVCSAETFDDMNRWVRCNEPEIDLRDERWQKDMNFTPRLISPGQSLRLGEYTVTALDSRHDPRTGALIYLVECHGKTVLYGTDLLEITGTTWEILSRCRLDAVFLDLTYGEGFNAGGHTDAAQVADIVRRMKAEGIAGEHTKIYATHISHEGNGTHEEMERLARPHGYGIAYDGMEIIL